MRSNHGYVAAKSSAQPWWVASFLVGKVQGRVKQWRTEVGDRILSPVPFRGSRQALPMREEKAPAIGGTKTDAEECR